MQKKLYILYILILAVLVACYICMSNRSDHDTHHGMMAPIEHNQLKITDAYARASSSTAKSGAVFFVIENGTDTAAHLTGAKSDIANKVELHTHKDIGDGVMQMMQIEDGVRVDANKRSMFKRGGNHVMLMGLNQSLNTGDVIALELTFDGQPMILSVTVDNERKAQMQH